MSQYDPGFLPTDSHYGCWHQKEQPIGEGPFHLSVHCVLSPFFLDPLDSSQRTPMPGVLLPCSRPNFAAPNRFLPTHCTVPGLYPKSFQRKQYFRFRTHGVALSTGSRSAAHRICPSEPSLLTSVSILGREHSCISLPEPDFSSESPL